MAAVQEEVGDLRTNPFWGATQQKKVHPTLSGATLSKAAALLEEISQTFRDLGHAVYDCQKSAKASDCSSSVKEVKDDIPIKDVRQEEPTSAVLAIQPEFVQTSPEWARSVLSKESQEDQPVDDQKSGPGAGSTKGPAPRPTGQDIDMALSRYSKPKVHECTTASTNPFPPPAEVTGESIECTMQEEVSSEPPKYLSFFMRQKARAQQQRVLVPAAPSRIIEI